MCASCNIIKTKIRRCAGFTLIELLIVLVIAVSIITISTVAYSKLSTSSYLKNSARHIAASLRYTRNYAITKGAQTKVSIDLDTRAYTYPGATNAVKFHKNIDLKVNSANFSNQDVRIAEIRFAPDGSSSGGGIQLSSKNRSYEVHVDWLTGLVTIHE